MTAHTRIFTQEYVEGLRRESQRKGARIRELEAALEMKTAEYEALRIDRGRLANALAGVKSPAP
jgi:hypothetical protein